jgi:hypothetical protein
MSNLARKGHYQNNNGGFYYRTNQGASYAREKGLDFVFENLIIKIFKLFIRNFKEIDKGILKIA